MIHFQWRSNNVSFIFDSPLSRLKTLNPFALRKAKLVCSIGLSECNMVKGQNLLLSGILEEFFFKSGHLFGRAMSAREADKNSQRTPPPPPLLPKL